MLPATLAQDVKRQIRHYLEATFNFRRPDEEAALAAFINDPADGLFKGPWVQVRRPFRAAHDGWDAEAVFDVTPPFRPFNHQWQAWQRLSSRNKDPASTIVTTGTGSGKTECFLFPVLDHCLRAVGRGERGIKAIILYPMNALASDQAGRFAEEIFSRPELHEGAGPGRRARIRVGLYTGRDEAEAEEGEGGDPDRKGDGSVPEMKVTVENGKEVFWHITDRQAMQEDPPDILLTNYKMLDYLLLRPKDRKIWRFNDPGRLRYLVLDELHTYDGAQGADVGCLIRRLKARLDVTEGSLCCVGTSATIAGGKSEEDSDPLDRLARFAGTLFEEKFTPAMIVSEQGNRLEIGEIVAPGRVAPDVLPSAADCTPIDDETAAEFAHRVAPLFGAPRFPLADDENPWIAEKVHKPSADIYWSLALGDWLRRQELFKALLDITQAPVVTWDALVDGLSDRFFSLRASGDRKDRDAVVAAFFALVAQGRQLRSGRALPLVPTQVQVWVRELRRLGRFVGPEPRFGWLDEKRAGESILPVAHCTECGEAAWVSMIDPDMNGRIGAAGVTGFQLVDEAAKIYQGFGIRGSQSPHTVAMSLWRPDDEPAEAEQGSLSLVEWYLAPDSLVVRQGAGPCPLTGGRTFRVKLNKESHRQKNGKVVGRVCCPHCGERGSLMFIGSRAATVSSVAIDEMFGSVLNNDPKLLAFTDSVQDASHRAGFFSARTYHFTFRTALQRIVEDAGAAGIPLVEVGDRLLDYWSVPDGTRRPGSMVETMGTLLPPDLREYGPYVDYRDGAVPGTPAPDSLRSEVARRLTWEATSEFGLMLTHGRTLELNGGACLGWNPDILDAVVTALTARLPGIDPALVGIARERLRLWILGILHRQRERGGLCHDYVRTLIRTGLWGKKSYGRIVEGREAFPPHGRYAPRLMADHPDAKHDHMLAVRRTGSKEPWQNIWARRSLGDRWKLAGVSDAAIADLTRALLEEGTEAGLFEQLQNDGGKAVYAIAASAARLFSRGHTLVCDDSGHAMFRPTAEAAAWDGSPSLSYHAKRGAYRVGKLGERQLYYQKRYRKGALRRVFAQEHTGLLTTQEREDLERRFNGARHADDPNVITATSTLEMGIDIGDLSTTMLCSIPPTTASYLQRIGRAGRTTGTALVVSVVNQRPHDLFFFARPEEMLAGKVEPPGCWLDASAMLVRQYLAFCFDSAVKDGVIDRLPSSGKRLVEDMEASSGPVIEVLSWMVFREAALQDAFLDRFKIEEVHGDTRERFREEATGERLDTRIRKATAEFGAQIKAIEAARRRLGDQKRELADANDQPGLREVERELRILRARMAALNRTSALEVLTEHGLLPNYAFPERGVLLTGTIYKDIEGTERDEDKPLTVDINRAAAVAIRELAPGNTFYTHGHQFDIQQLSIGTTSQPLVRDWAVCGKCGHMRPVADLELPGASPSCPQCGYDRQQQSQMDRAQWKPFLDFAQSGAISYMEYYDSLSGDRADEREQRFYRLVYSFDHTAGDSRDAVGNESEPFGLEFRNALVLRQVNTGLGDTPASFEFGAEQKVPELGFPVCQDCGITVAGDIGNVRNDAHRKSCNGRKRTEKAQREGREGSSYKWQRVYLYRELKSEAIRLLLPPDAEREDVSTLRACLFLGLRRHFRGNPGHLLIEPQILPDHKQDVRRHYLVLMDAVPGGTGFLKSLFDPKHPDELPGEGIMTVLRLALDALDSCDCRVLEPGKEDTDGCYRCIRAYNLQYKADEISRERGIKLLKAMIAAGEKRERVSGLDDIEVSSLFGSVLEKRFIDRLQDAVVSNGGEWSKSLVKGTLGFRLRMKAEDERGWEIQLQPKLGIAQSVAIQCQPDFMLCCDDAAVRPIAVFTDGFEYHVHPDKTESRLPDDAAKRRAILESGRYWVWNITWQDLQDGPDGEIALVTTKIRDVLQKRLAILKRFGVQCPPVSAAMGNGFGQLLEFLAAPVAEAWTRLAGEAALIPLTVLANKSSSGALPSELLTLHDSWRSGEIVTAETEGGSGEWLHATTLAPGSDLLAMARHGDVIGNASGRIMMRLRLGDSSAERSAVPYLERWRRWLGLANLLQFSAGFGWFCVSEAVKGTAPDLELGTPEAEAADWSAVLGDLLSSLRPLAERMAAAGIPMPEIEVYLEDAPDDCFAEMAWSTAGRRVCLLAGDQASFGNHWVQAGWTIVSPDVIHEKGVGWLAALLTAADDTDQDNAPKEIL